MDGIAQADRIEAQASKHSGVIGNGTSPDVIESLAGFAQDAVLEDFYNTYSDVAFWYQALDKPGLQPRVKAVVELWVNNQDNITRAERQIGRKADMGRIIKWYCLFRLKSLGGKKWKEMPEGLRIDDEEPQTFVFIALEDLGPENGFLFPLKRGQDVCVGGELNILIPPTGGGLGVVIVLRL